jgi:hypothetical protein
MTGTLVGTYIVTVFSLVPQLFGNHPSVQRKVCFWKMCRSSLAPLAREERRGEATRLAQPGGGGVCRPIHVPSSLNLLRGLLLPQISLLNSIPVLTTKPMDYGGGGAEVGKSIKQAAMKAEGWTLSPPDP